MLCPNCRFDNFEGENSCTHCGADLTATTIPEAIAEYHRTVLGAHLEALGVGRFEVVEPSMGVADAIRHMHTTGTDCLLVCEGGMVVGIFTDRDAVVKAADKRLGLYRVQDFMTPDPVVLRHDDTLAIAIHKMAVGGFRHIPIVEDGRPIGVVSAADVFRHLVAALG